MSSFDYVIAGGGTAASIIAYRLADKGYSVCVLEAGPADTNPYIKIPAGFIKTLFNPRLTWQYQYQPNEATNNRAIQVTQGKTLGGSSSVNGMVYNRGQAADFDSWQALGNNGWSYQDVLPYFRRTERHIGGGEDHFRGRQGRLTTGVSPWPSPLADAFVDSAVQQGHPFNDDYNGASQQGVGFYQSAINRGRRVSTASAFLRPAQKTGLCKVVTGALVSRIVFEGRRATGVAYLQTGKNTETIVNARREVIVAAGTINSAKLLQLSGIGPAELLQQHGITVRQPLAGVGKNFRDHFSPRIVVRAKPGVDTLNAHAQGLPLLFEVARWMLNRPSVLSISPALVHVFGKTTPELDRPDYSLVYTPGSYKEGFIGKLDDQPGMTCGAWQMRPESSGYVNIASADPHQPALADPNYLAEQVDRDILVKGLKAARSILQGEALAPYVEAESFPGDEVRSDDEWLGFARQYGVSSYHLVGTCKMGRKDDTGAVVDDHLRVHGVGSLRVADASIMPTMPSANTYAATMMIAEKAADLILGV